MVIVNYIEEHIRMMEYAAMNRISGNEVLVWNALFHLMNKRSIGNVWPDQFIPVPNKLVCVYSALSESSMTRARCQLINHGLIQYKPGKKKAADPEYKICFFDAKQVNDNGEQGFYRHIDGKTEGKTDGKTDGKTVNIRIDIDKDIYGDKSFQAIRKMEEETTTPCIHPSGANVRASDWGKRMVDKLGQSLRQAGSVEDMRHMTSMQMALRLNSVYAKMFNGYEDVYTALVESAMYPLEMVEEAFVYTERRYGQGDLAIPIAYTVRLLDDWKERGIDSLEQLNAAMGRPRDFEGVFAK